MGRASVAVFLGSANTFAATDPSSVLVCAENQIAHAIQAKDQVALRRLMADTFHESLSYGSILHNSTADLEREGWISRMTSGDFVSFETRSFGIAIAGPGSFNLHVRGVLTLRSAYGTYIRKQWESIDTWTKESNGWKLASRLSHVM